MALLNPEHVPVNNFRIWAGWLGQNSNLQRFLSLAGLGFTFFVFTSNGLAAPPVTFSYPPVTSQIPVPIVEVVPNPLRPGPVTFSPHGVPTRAWAFADFNGDGRVDILVAPTFGYNYPKLPIEIWLQEPNGTFVNRTSDVIEGPVPITGGVTDPLVADFNEDGRPDVFLVDYGLEDKFPFDGETNKLLLSQPNGRMVDASWRISPNPPGAHHNGAVADVDGDGHLDVMIVDIGAGSFPAPLGVFFLMGDGRGNFTRSVSRLPASIRFLSVEENNIIKVPDRHSTSGVAFADFDGDGRVDIVATPAFFDPLTGKQTVRFYRQMPDGTFVEQRRLETPPALAGIGTLLGTWRPGIGDINGDGLPDLAIEWEGTIPNYIQLLRNDGNFQFTDITIQALGNYQPQGADCSFCYIMKTVFADVNRDGFADLVLPYPVSIDDLLTTNAAVFLSEGDGRFSPWSLRTANGSPSADSLGSVLGCRPCTYKPRFIDFDGDGQIDLLLVDFVSNHTQPPAAFQTTAVRLHLFRQVGHPSSVPADFDGDRKTDIAVYRDGMWFILRSLGLGVTATGWGGLAQDVPVPGDFDGDRKTDLAVYRDGTWFIWRSSDGVQTAVGWGTVGDVPVQADYDGDGKTDQAVYRSGAWFIRRSSDGGQVMVGLGGLPQDKPVPGDYDGDGKTDIAVYRDGTWFIIRSSNGGVIVKGWGGLAQDTPVPGDYDGDGKTDIAVYRGGTWFIVQSSDGGVTMKGWGGLAQDKPMPADYDGDGKTDIAVYRDGTWFILRSSDGGFSAIGWGGLVQDIPLN
jgi:FG-GAP-like repeat